MINLNDSLGIYNFGPWYLEVLPNQDELVEFSNIYSFINNIIYDDDIDEFRGTNKNVQFINYGRTQLVFVVTIDNSRQYTLLVNQPATSYGTGKREFDNLNILSSLNPKNVIKPLRYIDNNYKELYITPYYYQTRCVGVWIDKWGMWVPEPVYHFVNFTEEQRKIINSVMVAILVELYDEENSKALSGCRLDGGDFMLDKGFENNEINEENILNSIKLIAARKLISISFDEYINNIIFELSGNSDKNIIIGKNLKASFTMEEIENGIELGLKNKEKIKNKIKF